MPTVKPTKIFNKAMTQQRVDGTIDEINVRHYDYTNDKKLNINDIERLAGKLREKFINKGINAKIQLIIQTPFGNKGGEWYDIKEREIDVYNPNNLVYSSLDNDKSNMATWLENGENIPKKFWFNVKSIVREGGCSGKTNDCLYACFVQVFGKADWDTPAKFKKYLQIKRNDLVNADDHIDRIEKYINKQIFIEGDITRVPKINSKLSLHLHLKNGHYTVAKNSLKKRVKNVSYKEQKPITYHYDEKDICVCYDGEKEYTQDIIKIREIKKNKLSSDFIAIKVKDIQNLQKEYTSFITEATKVKELTGGLVNMFKTSTYTNTALTLFNHFTKHIGEADKIRGAEALFILHTYRGGIMKAYPYEGEGFKYDVNSIYPFLMKGLMNFPYKEGEFIVLTNKEAGEWKNDKGKQYFKYGIYRCVVSGDINPILFKENTNNTYTHIDLNLALFLGYTITLVEDGTGNWLSYEGKTRLSGKTLFEAYINYLYPFKTVEINGEKNKIGKKLMNLIWGVLSQKKIYNKIYTTLEAENDNIVLEHDEDITHCDILGEDKHGDTKVKYETNKADDMFVNGLARISPFLTAQARSTMAHILTENLDDLTSVKRIHTDGFITSCPLKKVFPNKKDTQMGELGFEGRAERVVVKNMRDPDPENKLFKL